MTLPQARRQLVASLSRALPVLVVLFLAASPLLAQEAQPQTQAQSLSIGNLIVLSGLVGWIIIGLSVVMVAVVIEAYVTLGRERLAPPELIDEVQSLFDENQFQEAMELCENERNLFARVTAAGIAKIGQDFEVIQTAIHEMSDEEATSLLPGSGDAHVSRQRAHRDLDPHTVMTAPSTTYRIRKPPLPNTASRRSKPGLVWIGRDGTRHAEARAQRFNSTKAHRQAGDDDADEEPWYTLGAAYALFAASPALAQFHPIQDAWTPRPRVIQVTVDSSGFVPSEIHVKKGENVKLVFTRTVDRTCATAVVVRYLGIIRELPVGEAVAVALKAQPTTLYQRNATAVYCETRKTAAMPAKSP